MAGREETVNQYRIKACGRCGGDLALDDGDWRCLQCATYYYVGLYADTNHDGPDWLRQFLRPDNHRQPYPGDTGGSTGGLDLPRPRWTGWRPAHRSGPLGIGTTGR